MDTSAETFHFFIKKYCPTGYNKNSLSSFVLRNLALSKDITQLA